MAKKKTSAEENPSSQAPLTKGARGNNGGGENGYTVLARRYRPQQFSDLVGQEAVAQSLVNALKSNRVAHAYLFTGTRGVGKTSTARILAKALNCVNGPTPTPCDQCESCKAIAVGEDVDVIEIDGASNNKVEEIRELRQNVGFRPSRSRYKIYVIDEVHMLTTSAFNALLKTLEEPPPHVKFIFATTELHKIPITILSRCQRFDFIGIGTERILERLRGIVQSEGKEADDEALTIVARRAAGSMRDAQSLLDQVLAFGTDRITAKMVQQLLGTGDEDYIVGMATSMLERDVPKALALLHQGVNQGIVLGELIEQLVEYWRDLMVLKSAGPHATGLNFSARFHDGMRQQAEQVSLDGILAGLDLLSATKARLRDSRHAHALVEMLIVRMGRLENLVSVAELARQLLQGRSAGGAGVAPTGRSEPGATFVSLKKNSLAPEPTSPPAQGNSQILDASVILANTNGNQQAISMPWDTAHLPELWQALVAEVGTNMTGRRIASVLEKKDSVAISAPNFLVIRFPSHYTRERQVCEEPDNLARLEACLQKITGRSVTVRFDVVQGSEPPAEEIKPVPRVQQQRREALQEPLVRRAMESLGATLIRVDEGFGSVADKTNTQPEAEADDV